jgi:hypothetical protein
MRGLIRDAGYDSRIRMARTRRSWPARRLVKPATTICIRQDRRKALRSSRRRNVPSGNSSRNHRSRRSLSSRIRSRRNGNRRRTDSRRNRAKRVFRRAGLSRFPCRRRRMSTSSRRRFLPHRERFHDAVRRWTVRPLPIRQSMRMLRPPATTIRRRRRQFLTRVGFSPDAFASKLALLAA